MTTAANANKMQRATTSSGVNRCSFAFPSFPKSMMIKRTTPNSTVRHSSSFGKRYTRNNSHVIKDFCRNPMTGILFTSNQLNESTKSNYP